MTEMLEMSSETATEESEERSRKGSLRGEYELATGAGLNSSLPSVAEDGVEEEAIGEEVDQVELFETCQLVYDAVARDDAVVLATAARELVLN